MIPNSKIEVDCGELKQYVEIIFKHLLKYLIS